MGGEGGGSRREVERPGGRGRWGASGGRRLGLWGTRAKEAEAWAVGRWNRRRGGGAQTAVEQEAVHNGDGDGMASAKLQGADLRSLELTMKRSPFGPSDEKDSPH
jgi:hypothetical protein